MVFVAYSTMDNANADLVSVDALVTNVKPTSGVIPILNANVSYWDVLDEVFTKYTILQPASATLMDLPPTNVTEKPDSVIASKELEGTNATSVPVDTLAMHLTVHLVASASTTGMTF